MVRLKPRLLYISYPAGTRPAATQWQQKHNEPATESLLWNEPQLKDGGWLIYVTGQILPPDSAVVKAYKLFSSH